MIYKLVTSRSPSSQGFHLPPGLLQLLPTCFLLFPAVPLQSFLHRKTRVIFKEHQLNHVPLNIQIPLWAAPVSLPWPCLLPSPTSSQAPLPRPPHFLLFTLVFSQIEILMGSKPFLPLCLQPAGPSAGGVPSQPFAWLLQASNVRFKHLFHTEDLPNFPIQIKSL